MARETKVGLLAGLAFIICFAVILANRGSNAPPGLAKSFLPKGGLDLPKLVQRQQGTVAEANTSARNRNNQPARPSQQSPLVASSDLHQTHIPNGIKVATETVPPSGRELPLVSVTHAAAPNSLPTLEDNTRPVAALNDIHASLNEALRSKQPVDPARRQEEQVTISPVPLASAPPSQPIIDQPPIQTAEFTSEPEGTSHTVKPSETLSSIASRHYGTKSKNAVDAIFEANRNQLKDPNSVRAGMVLTVPKLDGTRIEKSQADEKGNPSTIQKDLLAKSTNRGETRKEKMPSAKTVDKKVVRKVSDKPGEGGKSALGFKWYQVKKNDRFASIAREQLGDSGRWPEVYELNKDKFPDPQKIREGVRIKLPTTTLAEAGKEKRP